MLGLTVVLCGSPVVRSRIRRHIEQAVDSARVVGEAPTPHAAAILTRRFAPNVVIVADDEEREEADYERIVDEIRTSTPVRVQVVLMPKTSSVDEVPGAVVLPRSRYTNRAMQAALSRVLKRV